MSLAHALHATATRLREVILADAAVQSVLPENRFYDAPPHSLTYPYAVLGDMTGRSTSAQDHRGIDATWRIDIYSRKPGRKEASTIASAFEAALTSAIDARSIGADGVHVVWARIDRVETIRQRNTRSFRAQIIVRALMEQAD